MRKIYTKEIKEVENEECLVNNCIEKPIKSHIVSRWILKEIADNNSNLYAVNENMYSQNIFAKMSYKRKSYGSSFKIFCESHDNNLFKKLDINKKVELWSSEEVYLQIIRNFYLVKYMEVMYIKHENANRPLPNMIINSNFIKRAEGNIIFIDNKIKELKADKITFEIQKTPIQKNFMGSGFYSNNLFENSIFLYNNSKECIIFNVKHSGSQSSNQVFNHLKKVLNSKKYQKQVTGIFLKNAMYGIYFNVEWFEKNMTKQVFKYYNSWDYLIEGEFDKVKGLNNLNFWL